MFYGKLEDNTFKFTGCQSNRCLDESYENYQHKGCNPGCNDVAFVKN